MQGAHRLGRLARRPRSISALHGVRWWAPCKVPIDWGVPFWLKVQGPASCAHACAPVQQVIEVPPPQVLGKTVVHVPKIAPQDCMPNRNVGHFVLTPRYDVDVPMTKPRQVPLIQESSAAAASGEAVLEELRGYTATRRGMAAALEYARSQSRRRPWPPWTRLGPQ